MDKKQKKNKANSIPVPATKETLDTQGFPSNSKKTRPKRRASQYILEEFKSKFTSMLQFQQFKPARLYNANGDLTKEWYVEYYCLDPNTGKLTRIKERLEINRIKNKQERIAYGREMVKFFTEKLKNGFSPFKDEAIGRLGHDRFIKGQLYVIAKELGDEGTHNSRSAFTEQYNRFIRFIEEHGYDTLLMEHITIIHAKLYRSFMRENELARKTVNASLSYMTNFWKLAIEKGWATTNPFLSVPRIKKHQLLESEKDTRFEPMNSEEMTAIFNGLIANQERNFIRYLGMIYYAWARPIEIARLRVSDIDFERELIRFRKYETKNGNAAYVQIVPPLKAMLLEMDLKQYDVNDYLFGLGFIPGKRKLRKNSPSEYWRLNVKERIGVQKDMYALKHTGNIEYLLRNKGKADLKWQQCQNRHSSSAMTERYNRKLGAYFIDLKNIDFRLFE